jgi:hypothetical protein
MPNYAPAHHVYEHRPAPIQYEVRPMRFCFSSKLNVLLEGMGRELIPRNPAAASRLSSI